MSVVNVKFQNKAIVPVLLAEAEARGCRPQQLVVALVKLTLEGGMVDAVLDGENPAGIAPRAGISGKDKGRLTPLQRKMLATVAARADSDGVAALRLADAAIAISRPKEHAAQLLGRLISGGLVEKLSAGGAATPSRYRITSAGHAALERGAR